MKRINKIFNLKKSVWLLCTLFIFTSCENFLEDELLSDTSVDFVYSTLDGLETGVVGLHDLNRQIYDEGANEHMVALLMQAKSDLIFPRGGAITNISRFNNWGITPDDFGTTNRIGILWRSYYRIVDRANAIIKAAEALDGVDENRKNQILAETKAFRANSYFTLYRQFNNIFITTEPTTPENAFDKPQDKSSVDEIFALINSDLDFAIANLEWTTPEFGRFTQATARHIRAKTAMWQKDWAEAKLQAETTINNGSYSLVSSTKDVFRGDLNNTEALLVIQYADEVIGGSRGTLIHFNLIPSYNAIPGADLSIENGGRGAGFIMPNLYLTNLLTEDPNDDRDNGTYYITHYTYNTLTNLPSGASIGDTIRIYDQFSTSATERNNYHRRLNPGVLKFFPDNPPVLNSARYTKNIMVYRLAETYLIAAEANMELGNTGDALIYINAVRTRAGADEINTIDQTAILDERARELAFEGQRWYTLKRMGVLEFQIKNHAGNVYLDNNGNQVSLRAEARDRYLPQFINLPIPQPEIDLLGPNYPQNDGY
tara:strand:- start:5885 stop:7513 length:1629 start_codon:yes stop_codon:yes gene_type:complete